MVHVKQDITKNNSWNGWLVFGLVSLLVMALFPYGWLADNWPLFDRMTRFLFGSEAVHVVAHVGLFVGLGTAVLFFFPRIRQYSVLYFGLITALGVIQEYLQLITFKNRSAGFGELFDLGVDLLAAGLVFVHWQHKNAAAQEKVL